MGELLKGLGNLQSGIGKLQYDAGINTKLSQGYRQKKNDELQNSLEGLIKPIIQQAQRDQRGGIDVNKDYDFAADVYPQKERPDYFGLNPQPKTNQAPPMSYREPMGQQDWMKKNGWLLSPLNFKTDALQLGMLSGDENYKGARIASKLDLSAKEGADYGLDVQKMNSKNLLDLLKAGDTNYQTNVEYGGDNDLTDNLNRAIQSLGLGDTLGYQGYKGLKGTKVAKNESDIAVNNAQIKNYDNQMLNRNARTDIAGGGGGSGEYWQLAQQVSQKTGIPAEFIYAQWYHETAGFSSPLAREDNNFGGLTQEAPNGMKQPDGSNYYRHFNSPEEYADEFANYIQKYKDTGIFNARTIRDYATALRNGGYFTDSVENYVAGMENALKVNPPGKKGNEKYVTVPGLGQMTVTSLLSQYKSALPKDIQYTDDAGQIRTRHDPGQPELVQILGPVVKGIARETQANQPVDQDAIVKEIYTEIDKQIKTGLTKAAIEKDIRDDKEQLAKYGIDAEQIIANIEWPAKMTKQLPLGNSHTETYDEGALYR